VCCARCCWWWPGILAARTTNFSRTKATLAGVLRGLYPEHRDPIPVVTSGQMDEVLYADTKACPHLHVLLEASAAMVQGEGMVSSVYDFSGEGLDSIESNVLDDPGMPAGAGQHSLQRACEA
jgi:hypothetical protein